MNNNESTWACPVCNASRNASGEPLVSEWAVACHIAGKMRTGDRLHKSWALSKAPDLEVKAKQFKIAERLTWAVVEAQREQEMLKETRQIKMPQVPFEKISKIERSLHKFIENTLKREFVNSDQEWWVKGIPMTVRRDCAQRREEDDQKQNLYNYTYLIDLQSILNKNWALFEANFQNVSKQCKSKNEFLNNLAKLNEIRNFIMHPVRQQDELSPEETQFLDWFDNLTREFASSD